MCPPLRVDGYVGFFAKGLASLTVGVMRGTISRVLHKVFLSTSSHEACHRRVFDDVLLADGFSR